MNDALLPRERPLLIGLTGPIGCGKSTVARMLASAGGRVIDADALAREVTGPREPALAAIRARFGDGVFDVAGELDRAALARVVFADPSALRDLEGIVHPLVRQRLAEDLRAAIADGVPFVALEAIKLVEGGLAAGCDEVWLIDCPPHVQRQRLAQRAEAATDAEQRLLAQGEHLADRLAEALEGVVRYRRLSTAGSLEETGRRVGLALADALSDRYGAAVGVGTAGSGAGDSAGASGAGDSGGASGSGDDSTGPGATTASPLPPGSSETSRTSGTG